MEKKFRYSMRQTVFAASLMIFLIMLPSIINHHGYFIIRGDYVDQYISRIIKAKQILSEGGFSWDWYNFLGGPFNFFSSVVSLNAICLLFPIRYIPYAVTLVNIVKFALAAMASYAYLSVMIKNRKHVALGAILYTFSSFCFINLEFMQFIDAVWTFPLILLSAENMFRCENYKHSLILTVFITAAINLYFFVSSTILFAIYFLVRFFFSEDWQEKRKAKYFFMAFFEYLLGFLCAALTYAIFVYQMFNSAGSTGSLQNKKSIMDLLFDTTIFSKVFAFFAPAASNRFDSFGYSRWQSRAAYVPVFGMSMFFAGLFKYKLKKWNNKLILILGIFTVIPFLSMSFNMYSSSYTRWFYGIVLFLVLATVQFLDDYDKDYAKKGIAFNILCIVLLLGFYYALGLIFKDNAFLGKLTNLSNSEEYSAERLFRIFGLISILAFYAVLIWYYNSDFAKKNIVPIAVVLIVVYGMGYVCMNTTSMYLMDNYTETKMTLEEQVDVYYGEKPELSDDGFYRIDFPKNCNNYALTMLKPSISAFESVRGYYGDEITGYTNLSKSKKTVRVYPNDASNALRTWLGVKYYIDYFPEDNTPVPNGFSYLKTDKGCEIYKNNNYIGMGFTYDYYITRSEFEKLADGRPNSSDILLDLLVVNDEDVNKVSDILKPYDGTQADVSGRIAADKFKGNSKGFTAHITLPEEKVVFISVPYEKKGWTAEINGEKTEFINAGIGFMAVRANAGDNTITFTYTHPALKIGLYVSLLGIAMTAIYLLISRKKHKLKSTN